MNLPVIALLGRKDEPARVLSEASYRVDLAARGWAAYQCHFAWSSIAVRFADILRKEI